MKWYIAIADRRPTLAQALDMLESKLVHFLAFMARSLICRASI
ncbi:hypothetical protein ACNKHR_01820 [Shigella flexneri]